MKRRIYLLSLLTIVAVALFVFWPSGNLKADDRSIFSSSTKPYVMLLLDNSGSMHDQSHTPEQPGQSGFDFAVTAADYNTFRIYTLSTGKIYTFYSSGNATTAGYATRIMALKRVTVEILDKYRDKVKMGFANYFYPADVAYHVRTRHGSHSPYTYTWDAATWDDGMSVPCGAVIRAGITDLSRSADGPTNTLHNAQLEAMCDAVMAFTADGNTPLAESLDTIYGYYKANTSGNCLLSDTTTYPNTWTATSTTGVGVPRLPAGTVPPTQYSCQQNYVIMVTDGEPTHDEFGSGTVVNYTSNCSTCWENKIVYDYSHKYTGATVDSATGGFTDVTNVAGWMSANTLVAGQLNGGVHTWAVGLRLTTTNANNLKAACAAGGGTYLAGNDYASLSSGLMGAFESINLSSFAFSSYTSPKKITSATDNTYVSYSGYFLNKKLGTSIWEGHLKCLEIVPVPATNTYAFDELWDAAPIMYAQGASSRVLKTQVPKDYSGGKFTYTNLDFTTASVTSDPTTWLPALDVSSTATATTTVDYIRGSAAMRKVDTTTSTLFLLGDIFHSDVIYVGKPMRWKWIYNTSDCLSTATTSPSCFVRFYADNVGRTKVIHLGTNDGVIHTINADLDPAANGGKEIGGFVPDEVLYKLKTIAGTVGSGSTPGYTYTTDGRMTYADIYSTANKWQSILVFGLREGGNFYYCRKVTDPGSQSTKWKFPEYEAAATITSVAGSNINFNTFTGAALNFSANQILVNARKTAKATISTVNSGTQITVSGISGFAAGDRIFALPAYAKYVGQTWGKPVIGRLKVNKGTEQALWVVILTGGYGDGTGSTGKALFIVDADTGALIWYVAYATTDSITVDHYEKNNADLNYPIPQSITAVDLNNDTYIDSIYFGNTGGNLFKLNVANSLTTTWIPSILFRGTTTSAQPIYLAPSVSYDQCYKLWLHFGTGKRNDPQNAPTGQCFAIMDNPAYTYPLTATTTVLQKLTWIAGTSPLPDTTSTTTNTTKAGWYFDFIDNKETIFDPDPVVIPDNNLSYLYFNTYEPAVTETTTDPCGSGGNMHVYSIKLPNCGTSANPISGEREEARIAGGGMTDDGYLQYLNTSVTGSITTKRFEKYTLQYPGGVFYFKEIIR
jgi:hypothetical protein